MRKVGASNASAEMCQKLALRHCTNKKPFVGKRTEDQQGQPDSKSSNSVTVSNFSPLGAGRECPRIFARILSSADPHPALIFSYQT